MNFKDLVFLGKMKSWNKIRLKRALVYVGDENRKVAKIVMV